MRALPRGEHALHPLLVALLLLILVVKPMADLAILPGFAMSAGLILVILTGIFCLDGAPYRRRNLTILVLLGAGGLQGLALGAPGPAPSFWAMCSAVLALMALAAAILHQVFAAGPITMRRIEGAIAAYLLLGLIFASIYDLLHRLVPEAFLHHGVLLADLPSTGSYIFFSFVTLTTTGYGDIVPVHPVARSLAVLEAITGQLFLAVLLARLVSLQVAHRD